MKKLLIFIILNYSFLIVNSFAQSYGWIYIGNNIPGDSLFHDLSDVYFINDDEGWVTSSSHAEIYHTTDGGDTFEIQTTPLGTTTAIQMLDADNGYAGGDGGWIYKTTDGGLNWNTLASMGTFLDISFPAETNPSDPVGYACGNSGNVWEITSGLTNLNTGLSGDFNGISAPSVNNVWVCGGNRIYYYNGTNITSQFAPTGTFNDIHFINNQEGWVVGDFGVIARTTNGGTLWVTQTNPDTQNRSLSRVFFLDSNKGWAVGNGGIILQTIDGGTTWIIKGTGLTSAYLRGVHFTSSTNGYVVGNGKTLLKYGAITSVDNEEKLPTEFSLSQNYPNPFNPSTTIEYQIPELSFVTLKVYDVLGKEIAVLVNEEKSVGTFEVEFNSHSGEVRNLPSGVYFYQLKAVPTGRQAGVFVETKKMLLLK